MSFLIFIRLEQLQDEPLQRRLNELNNLPEYCYSRYQQRLERFFNCVSAHEQGANEKQTQQHHGLIGL